jgi:dienelactone hydrolase
MIRMLVLLILAGSLQASPPGDPLSGTLPLEEKGNLADLMMRGLHRWAEARIEESVAKRKAYWNRDPQSREAYERSVAGNRERFQKILGIVDPLQRPRLERFGSEAAPALAAQTPRFRAWQVRWDVLEGVTGEGLYLEPLEKPVAHVVALPDADQTPEQLAGLTPGVAPDSQFARRLAENGCAVIVPVLISREFEFSGHPEVAWTNQSHREWIYRQAYHLGRHVIGYEIQKVRAAAQVLRSLGASRVGVAGYGEGGLVAFYAAAADPQIDSAFVSGFFGPREGCWKEPLYRHVWSLLREFGDAEVATLIAPRGLVVEAAPGPTVPDPVRPPAGRRPGAAAGNLSPFPFEAVQGEFERIQSLLPEGFQPRRLVRPASGFGSPEALRLWASDLGFEPRLDLAAEAPLERRAGFSLRERQGRQVRELERHVQSLLGQADRARDEFFLGTTSLLKGLESRGERFRMYRVKTRDPEVFARETEKFRTLFWEEAIGRIEEPLVDPHPRSRRIYDRPKWTGYDIVLETAPEFFAWGALLVPKDLKPGERRPVVVCQHGRNGLPKDTIEGNTPAYRDFAAKLADEGFVVFSPHNPYRGEDLYRLLNRKANLVKATLFSLILQQHRQILAWLKAQPFVDPDRIGFYGLSYGGETAVRVPPILKDYCLSICSGDFNDWARKVATTDSDYSFMYSIEWEMPYFNWGRTFNYAEMAYLMVPRPFMVERGHHDGVAPDPWVASEYAKVRWLYDQLGLGDRTEIEIFNGGHTINGEKTFEFLRRHLGWPPR